MAKYYEEYKILIVATVLSGVYFPPIEQIYGSKRKVRLLKYLCILPGLALPLYLASALKYQFFDEDDVANKIYGFTLLVYLIFVNSTFFGFYYYRYAFVRLFELWDSMFREDLYPEEREVLLRQRRNMTNKWLIACGGLGIASSCVYFVAVFFNPDKKLPHPTGFPYRHQSPDFELMNCLDVIVMVFGLTALLSFDSITMTFLSFEETQLRHLKRSLARILDTVRVTEFGNICVQSEEITDVDSDEWKIENAYEEVDRNFRIWLSQHHQIIRFHNEFAKVFHIPVAIKFTIFVLIICLVCFLILAGRFALIEIGFSVSFCFISYGVFYINIMYADSILELGESIFGDAFEKSWYLYPKKFTDAFLIILLNSHRPVHYLAFKNYSLSSSNFLSILSSAYSLLAFLLQTNRRKIKVLELQTPSRSI